MNQAQLAEACFVVNVLDSRVKKDLLTWYVKLQLSEYLVLFAEDQEVCLLAFLFLESIENIKKLLFYILSYY